MSDLVVLLRAMADKHLLRSYDVGDYWNVCDDAADEIERLQARIAAYEVGVEFSGEKINRLQDVVLRQQDVVDAALAECREVINAPRVPEGERDVAENISRILDGEVKPCPTCNGNGRERLVTGKTKVGNVVIRQVDSVKCSTCGGSGEVKP
jgi:hypothetical protein